jgi:glycosyltransferase involved in cell wall biosynthesis
VLAGRSTPAAAEWLDRLRRPPFAGRVDVPGYVPDRERRALFERASLLVLPSWNEGFGMPVLEALALGVPVVASNRGALPEVGGDAVLYCDPSDPVSIADAIGRTLADEMGTEFRIERGRSRVGPWSWDATGAAMWGLYRDVVDRHRGGRADRD